MLVLTRKHQEKIRIGNNIVITVLKMKGKAVRLGIEAPVEVPVIRGELTFEGRTTPWQPQTDGSGGGGDVPLPQISDAGCANSQTGRGVGAWPARPVRVSLQRVPREQASQILPRLASDSGPLRAMLARRSVTA